MTPAGKCHVNTVAHFFARDLSPCFQNPAGRGIVEADYRINQTDLFFPLSLSPLQENVIQVMLVGHRSATTFLFV